MIFHVLINVRIEMCQLLAVIFVSVTCRKIFLPLNKLANERGRSFFEISTTLDETNLVWITIVTCCDISVLNEQFSWVFSDSYL